MSSVVRNDRHRYTGMVQHRVGHRTDVRPRRRTADAAPDDEQGGVPGRLQQMLGGLPAPRLLHHLDGRILQPPGTQRLTQPGGVHTAQAGSEVFGHEFHYASVLATGDEPLVECRDAAGEVVPEAGARRGTVSGTFFHFIDGQQT